jgi:hypothetical protein
MSRNLLLPFAASTHAVINPLDKLLVRAQLPGAFGFDQGAHTMRLARAKGLPFESLLACAMPASWMVNNRTTSPVFKQWLSAPMMPAWGALCEALTGGYAAWSSRTRDERKMVGDLVRALAIEGQGVAAISKVLAYLVMETVPLMDDALVFAVLGERSGLSEPVSADSPKASASVFVSMLDWFAQECERQEHALIALARDYSVCVLDVAQVLDRLLWFESWGWTYNYGAGQQFVKLSVSVDGTRHTLIARNEAADSAPGERKDFVSLEAMDARTRALFDNTFTAV